MKKTKRYTVKYGIYKNGSSTFIERGQISRKREAIATAARFWNENYGDMVSTNGHWITKPSVYRWENDGTLTFIMSIGNH